jgi:COMPASS component SPP1
MPPGSIEGEGEEDQDPDNLGLDGEVEGVEEDDKLYCICKTRYDEEKVMIACDRCDEWFHTQCVGMQEAEVELVDQFICSGCVESA